MFAIAPAHAEICLKGGPRVKEEALGRARGETRVYSNGEIGKIVVMKVPN
ncbi:MAG: hypothetical protein JRN19_04020 [Nitrososphaerota archaeon]|nr:hypothetical protein [Nitrososphaerota archaeon]MDG7049432.1 hypothetical protein [Nitrososphaerota archaeon]MDG7051598.1 hypothetical protein [Nitrososphaerota archaeon]